MKPWRNQLTTVTEIKPLSGDLKSQTGEFVCSNSKQESLCAAIQNRRVHEFGVTCGSSRFRVKLIV